MICVIALVVFGVLGIFSIKYRVIAKEALDCVFRRVTLRKCTTGLDQRLKSQITGNLMQKSPALGRFTFRNFEVISWFFTIIMVLSIIYSVNGAYNFAAYGNCNGKGSDEFCIFDPFGNREHLLNEPCSVTGGLPDIHLLKPDIGASPSIGNVDSDVAIIEFGCYTCQYTREAEATMEEIRETYGSKHLFVFKHFPIPTHNYSYESAIAAECARNQGKFWEYHELLYGLNGEVDDGKFLMLARMLGLDTEAFKQCYDNQETKDLVDGDIEEGKRIGIYGTPTVFVGDDYLVGPKSFREYKRLIRKND